jgi:hypothetical protein
MLALLLLAHVDNTGGAAPLTLIFPLVLVFIVAGLWVLAFRHFRRDL